MNVEHIANNNAVQYFIPRKRAGGKKTLRLHCIDDRRLINKQSRYISVELHLMHQYSFAIFINEA